MSSLSLREFALKVVLTGIVAGITMFGLLATLTTLAGPTIHMG